MQGDSKIIGALNEILMAEITGINQYFIHAKMCENWGYKSLYDFNEKNSVEEMKHAEVIIERLLFLEGAPVMNSDKLHIGSKVKDQLENDYELEKSAIQRLQKYISLCVEVGDAGTRELLERILVDEERHANDLEEHLQQIKDIGIENYLSIQVTKSE